VIEGYNSSASAYGGVTHALLLRLTVYPLLAIEVSDAMRRCIDDTLVLEA